MTNQLPHALTSAAHAKARLDAMRPLPAHTLASLREALVLEWTYHSNAIEGNTLTLRETKVVLEGITVGGKTLREHFEAINHRDAIGYVEEIVANQEPLNERIIRDIHALVLKGIQAEEAGRYRQDNAMQDLVTWYAASGDVNPIVRAAELHTRFVQIHPFVDGNGRTGRLLLNLVLMQAGYPPAIIQKEERSRYYDVLDAACVTQCYDGIALLVAEAVQRSLDVYLRLLAPPN